jgi:hypothetical protein
LGFLRRRAERNFYRSLGEQHALIAEAAVEFFSTPKELAADSTGEAPEPVCVSVTFTHDAPRPAADLCLVGQYIAKMGSNLHGSPAYDLFWTELSDCSEWDEIGPAHLQAVSARPKKPTRTYNAKLYETPNGWIAFTPYDKTGGEGYYAPMSAFALIRIVRAGLGANAESLDQLLDHLAGRALYDPEDTWAQVTWVHNAMQDVGVFDLRQLPPDEARPSEAT